jgi:hypothetical protein
MFVNKLSILFIFFILFDCSNKKDNKTLNEILFASAAYQAGTTMTCTDAQLKRQQNNRVFQSGFETAQDFSSFYTVPQNYQNAASNEFSTEQKHSGNGSHKGWIYAKGPTCAYPANCNHRGYPTVQLHKLPSGGFKTPVYIEFYSYLDLTFTSTQDWFSFATFSADASNNWTRVVLINTDIKGYAYLAHVPTHNQNVQTFQTTTILYPQKKWVKISACLDFDPNKGFAKVWQDDVLVSEATVQGTCSVLEQAHFGLYASPSFSSGAVYNDDLLIKEVTTCP